MKIGKYKHVKDQRFLITPEILAVGKHSETLEEFVVYKALYGEGQVWIRPKEMFLEKVIVDGKEVLRFEFVGL